MLDNKTWDEHYKIKRIGNYYINTILYPILNNYKKKKITILDLGCGPYLPVARYFNNSLNKITAIDFSKTAITLAKRTAKKNKLTNIKLINNDISKIDFSQNEFDLILDSTTLQHLSFKDLKNTLRNLNNSLKKNGSLISLFQIKHKKNKFKYNLEHPSKTINLFKKNFKKKKNWIF